MTPTSDYAIAFSSGAAACMYIFKQVYLLTNEKKNGNGKTKTFAQDPERYWEQMRANVTEPLARILDGQTRVLQEQVRGNNEVMLKLVMLEERTKR